jgi:hypothetical protein
VRPCLTTTKRRILEELAAEVASAAEAAEIRETGERIMREHRGTIRVWQLTNRDGIDTTWGSGQPGNRSGFGGYREGD